jgi:hypothetical protein
MSGLAIVAKSSLVFQRATTRVAPTCFDLHIYHVCAILKATLLFSRLPGSLWEFYENQIIIEIHVIILFLIHHRR